MRRLSLVGAPASLALRRLRARPAGAAATLLALAAASALIGWSSLAAARSHETSVHLRLSELPPRYRSLRVVYFTLPGETDFRAPVVASALHGFSSLTSAPHRVRVWHSIERNKPDGTRLVVAARPERDVVLSDGRLPHGCEGAICEALALSGSRQVGERVPLGKGRFALIVGRGTMRPVALPDATELGSRALLVARLGIELAPLVRGDGSTVVTSAALDPARVRGFELGELRGRLRRTIVRLERGDDLVRPTAPLRVLDSLAARARVARERLLLVAGETAALIVAFAAFAAAGRRRESELLDTQLATLGASRLQVGIERLVETALPVAAGALLGLTGVWAGARMVASEHGWPRAFVAAALPRETAAVIGACALGAALLLLVAGRPARRSRLGFGALELAALTALAVVVWQTWATGALDPEQVARGGSAPVIVLLPALAFFSTGVVLLRVVPVVLHLGERLARHGPFGARLAFLAAARNPAQAAAATTFVAVAVGAALFSLQYRATLERQAHDQARFAAGAGLRVVERGRGRQPDVTPLTRFARVTSEPATAVLRLDGELADPDPRSARVALRVLGLPAARVPELLGWRPGFSRLSRETIARRLRPTPVRLHGPRLGADVRALRVWARSRSDSPRLLVFHFLLPGQDFAHVAVGLVGRRWRLLHVDPSRSLSGAQLVAVELAPVGVRIDFKYDPKGFAELGPVEQLSAGRWSALGSLAGWRAAVSTDQGSGILTPASFVRGAPVEHGVRYDYNGTFQPLIHPKLGLPSALPGFRMGAVPALASDEVASHAVDGLITLDVPGKQIPVRIVGTARLFPTIVQRPSSFVVLDYDTLFAALNGDEPGLALPGEAWFFHPRPDFAAALDRAPFRVERSVAADTLERRLLADPLAAGTRSVLGAAALVASLLAVAGLILATRSALGTERLQIAEYEALGVPPRSLRRSARVRIAALAGAGLAAGVAGAFAGLRLIGGFVAVTGTGTAPLPPIAASAAWPAVAATVAVVAAAAVVSASMLASRALREPPARRLRA